MAGRWSMYRSDTPQVSAGWSFEEVVGPSALAGGNGMAFGPDGRLHVTQVFGSQVTAIDVDGGRHELFAGPTSGIVGPDDGFFGADGTFFATEPLIGRVSALAPGGAHRVVRDGLPGANGITMDHDRRRLFVDEFRPGGRLLELDPTGESEPEVLLEDLAGPNALAMGPDGRLYLPQVFAGQVWSYDLDERRARLVVDDLAVPTAVKFDAAGRLVVPEAGAGRVVAIDPASGRREVLAEVPLGIDNVSVGPGDRVFVSHYVDGRVAEVSGGRQRVLAASGLLGPYGLAVGDGGRLLVADALSVAAVDADGRVHRLHRLLIDLPGMAVGVWALGGDLVVLAAAGELLRYRADGRGPEVLASGLQQPTGLVGDRSGSLFVAERAAGRVSRVAADGAVGVVASDLRSPAGIALGGDGTLYVSHGPGPVTVLDVGGGRREVGDFGDAQGLALVGATLVVADVGRRELRVLDPSSGRGEVAVCDAPIGPPAEGLVPGASCALCSDGGGGVYVGANGDGSIRRLRPR